MNHYKKTSNHSTIRHPNPPDVIRKDRAANLPPGSGYLHQTQITISEYPRPGKSPRPRLRHAIAQLPAHLRNVIVLRDLSRMPYEEVGRTLGIDPATARVYRRHAVVKLAELIGAEE